MPYSITKRGSQYCVVKDSDGKTMGCHASRTKARRQQKALYAAEASAEGSAAMDVQDKDSIFVDPNTASGTTASVTISMGEPIATTIENGNWTVTGPLIVRNNGFTNTSNPELAIEETEREPWEGVLATVMSPTSDGRIIEEGVGFRDLPVPFSVQMETAEGHMGAEVCGRIEEIEFIPFSEFDRKDEFDMDEVRENAIVVYGRGSLDGSEAASEAKRYLDNGAGVSLDGLHFTGNVWNSEDLSEVDVEAVPLDDLFAGIMSMTYLRGMGGKIAGVTVVNIPAFEEANVLVASAVTAEIHFGRRALTASAAGLAPLAPPREWFEMPEPNEITPLTVTKEGRVYGHLALWDQCHTAFASCERPPRSASGYAYFHTGQLETAEGDLIDVGRITVGNAGNAKGGHASLVLGRQGAMEHYEKTGCVGAFVRARDGVLGIWLSGAVRSDAPAERVRDMRANPLSGDWRDYELIAALSVTCGGFPIARFGEARLVASADGGEEVAALVATAYTAPVGSDIMDGDTLVGMQIERWTFPCELSDEMDILSYRRGIKKLKKRRKAMADET